MSNALKVSDLPRYMSDVKQAAGLLVAAGCDKEGTEYTFTAAQFAASGLSLDMLSLLLTKGMPQTSTQKGIVRSFAKSRDGGEVAFSLNYDLLP